MNQDHPESQRHVPCKRHEWKSTGKENGHPIGLNDGHSCYSYSYEYFKCENCGEEKTERTEHG